MIRPYEARDEEAVWSLVETTLRDFGFGAPVGSALYAHAETFARSAGYEKIWLDSSRRFTAARRLYEKNGFVLLEELDNDWQDNVYEKSLRLESA